MSKVQFSDVVPPEKRSIRNVPIPSGGKRKSSSTTKVEILKKPEAPTPEEEKPSILSEARDFALKDIKNSPAYEYYYPRGNESQPAAASTPIVKKGGSKKRHLLFLGAVLVVAGFFLATMMTVFASATVTVTPKTKNIPIAMKITASPDKTDGSVRYEVIKVTKSETASVPASGEEEVELKSHGKVVIYNNFSTSPQRLIARTRLESPEGLIYRIPESIVVPGKSGSTPGSIEVEVFADETGDKYNIKKTDFTIPGFKDDKARYQGFYARSSTDMEGGFVGKRKTVSDSDKSTALQTIESDAESALEKDLASKVPNGLTLVKGSTIYESHELPQSDQSSSVILGKEVTAYAIMLNIQDLSDAVKSEYIRGYPDWQNMDSSVQDFSNIQVVKRPDSIDATKNMDIEISGNAALVAKVDTEKLKESLAGKSKNSIMALINQFAGISGVKVTIRPMWKRSFPADTSKISVKLSLPE